MNQAGATATKSQRTKTTEGQKPSGRFLSSYTRLAAAKREERPFGNHQTPARTTPRAEVLRNKPSAPCRAPVFSLPPCTAHSLFSQKREWGVHWTSPQRAADHPARQREYRPPLRQRSAPPPRPSGRAPAPLSGGKRKPPQASRLRANTNPRYHLNSPGKPRGHSASVTGGPAGPY